MVSAPEDSRARGKLHSSRHGGHGTEGTEMCALPPCRGPRHARLLPSPPRKGQGGRTRGRTRKGQAGGEKCCDPRCCPAPRGCRWHGKRAMSRRDSHVCMLISGAGRGCARRCTAHRARTCHACCVAPLFSPELLPPPPGLWSILRMPGSAGPSCACLFGADGECRDMADRELLATLCLSSPRRSIQMNHSLPETCQQKPNALGALGSLGPAKEY